MKDFILKLNNYLNSKIRFEFTGGEPTSYKNIIELSRFITSLNHEISIFTNGSKPINWWNENSYLFKYINLSYHIDFTNKKHIKNVIFSCNKSKIHINVMALPNKFNECFEIAKELKTEFNTVSLQPIVNNFSLSINLPTLFNYTEEQLNILRNQKEYLGNPSEIYNASYLNNDVINVLANGKNKFKGYKCNIGKNYLVIDVIGFIHKAWCMRETLGHIIDVCFDNIYISDIISKEGIICNKEICHCYSDMIIPKERLINA